MRRAAVALLPLEVAFTSTSMLLLPLLLLLPPLLLLLLLLLPTGVQLTTSASLASALASPGAAQSQPTSVNLELALKAPKAAASSTVPMARSARRPALHVAVSTFAATASACPAPRRTAPRLTTCATLERATPQLASARRFRRQIIRLATMASSVQLTRCALLAFVVAGALRNVPCQG
jgi:hypothetical protein